MQLREVGKMAVYLGRGEGDRAVESPEVKILDGWGKTWSDPSGG